jgi:hypothetical protein
METDCSQPNSAPRPSTTVESYQFHNKTASEYEPATPMSWNAKPSEVRRSPPYSSKSEFPEAGSTPQPGAGGQTNENDKAWASRRVPEIQAQIQALKRDSDTRIIMITRIEQEVQDVKKQDGTLYQAKQEEIAHVLREIEKRYEREHELLRKKEETLNESKESELEGLRRNARQVERNEKKMKTYQTLVDLDGDSEDGN